MANLIASMARGWKKMELSEPNLIGAVSLRRTGQDRREQLKQHWSQLSEPQMSESLKEVQDRIKHSKRHWSQLSEPHFNAEGLEEEVSAEIDNREAFRTLQLHPKWGSFFQTFGYDLGVYGSFGELEVGAKFAEGGQAELFHAQVIWQNQEFAEDDMENGIEYVLKVFKKGSFLRHLQKRWPNGFLDFYGKQRDLNSLGKAHLRFHGLVVCGTLLTDGRFAFLMVKEHEDLRSLIDRRMKSRPRQPFSKEVCEVIMWAMAKGMDTLHRHDIVHRDLKASNVLIGETNAEIKPISDRAIFIADYECSAGVKGTGFFRAPEILQACKDGSVEHSRRKLFTKKADIYSYGMTCYEILTGKLPFEGHPIDDFDLVLNGHRPKIPEHVDDWVRQLLTRCWEANRKARPSFREIVDLLVANSTAVRELDKRLREFLKEKRRAMLHMDNAHG